MADYINTPNLNCPAFYDEDDEYTIQYREYLENSSNAITLDLSTEEPDNSLSMGDEHLSTISETELDKLIKSGVENLVSIPSKSKDFSDNESECDVPNLILKISDATIESSSPFPIPVEDSDSLMEEIDLFLDSDDSISPGIESDDYDSDGDILFLEELLSNDSLSLPESESFHFDHYDVLSSLRPPAKPPDDGIFFDFEPDAGVLTAKVVEDISEHYVLMPKLLPTQPTLCPNNDTLLLFSSENEDKVFNTGILSSSLLSHRGKIIFDFSESSIMIHGGDIPISDVPFLHFYPP
ncbi:hypothetical protein Tco_1563138 [Tanacetum coccineum]